MKQITAMRLLTILLVTWMFSTCVAFAVCDVSWPGYGTFFVRLGGAVIAVIVISLLVVAGFAFVEWIVSDIYGPNKEITNDGEENLPES